MKQSSVKLKHKNSTLQLCHYKTYNNYFGRKFIVCVYISAVLTVKRKEIMKEFWRSIFELERGSCTVEVRRVRVW